MQCRYTVKLTPCGKQIEVLSTMRTDQVYAHFSNVFRYSLDDIQLMVSHRSLLDSVNIEISNTTGLAGQGLPITLAITSTSDLLDIATL